MKKMILFGISALLLSGCATALTYEASRLIQLDQNQRSQVKNCKMLGEVSGTSSYGGLFMQEAGKNYAKNEAMNMASGMAATHVVWTTAEGGFMGGKAYGVAYKCDKSS